MLLQEKTLSTEQQTIQSGLEKIAKQYGEKFIAERVGYYMFEFIMVNHDNTVRDIESMSHTLNSIRLSLLSIFNRPGSYSEIEHYINDDESCVVSIRKNLRILLEVFIPEITNKEESEDSVTRKDIDFLLDLRSMF